jgi:NADH-quinone oxidoreductase subunit C
MLELEGETVLRTKPIVGYLHTGMEKTGEDLTYPNRAVPAGITRERFEVTVNLLSLSKRERVRVRCQVPESDPVVPTLVDLFAGADAPEREVFDMFGIRFDGHPDLTRILMPEDWEGHPLRKDYGVGRIPVQFKAAPGAR